MQEKDVKQTNPANPTSEQLQKIAQAMIATGHKTLAQVLVASSNITALKPATHFVTDDGFRMKDMTPKQPLKQKPN
jgi:hypothetical protein